MCRGLHAASVEAFVVRTANPVSRPIPLLLCRLVAPPARGPPGRGSPLPKPALVSPTTRTVRFEPPPRPDDPPPSAAPTVQLGSSILSREEVDKLRAQILHATSEVIVEGQCVNKRLANKVEERHKLLPSRPKTANIMFLDTELKLQRQLGNSERSGKVCLQY